MPVDLHDTICALSTARGRSGIAVVRMSGQESFVLLRRVFRTRKSMDPRRATLGVIFDPRNGAELDEGIVTCFPGPSSYTGEDVVEISIHGSPVLVSSLLDCLCSQGARLAEPGEFTLRAFVNGRMDLSQAEAVRDIIEATTLYQAQVAARQRSGEIARQLQPVKSLLIEIIVNLESAVEFVEENLPLQSRERLAEKLEGVRKNLGSWVDSFRRGRIVRDGFNLAIVGRPNVGKSSLFNALLAQDRSIVTEIPGTTRDLVSEFTNLEGIPVRLVDTAGLRRSVDRVEQLGVDRSMRAIADADAILLVVDTSRPQAAEDAEFRERLESPACIVVMNKADVPSVWSTQEKALYAGGHPCVEVSALFGTNMNSLREAILRHLFGGEGPQRDGILITNLRHCRCLETALAALEKAADALREGLSEEFVLVDLHDGLKSLGTITGETSVEDLLGEIFSRFCIGK
ncbi:MAG TPA: tRNA uridine-5-carboxymethylaminomethyl(34) synthesis GTPase MnmE [Acidobacteriota bacterium]|nr:tRNA uridine-5-carboxymethylaminomethyl(34) synthesis GTPase MnmE [Acidobacteriota bacterium]